MARILIVEDSPSLSALYSSYLDNSECEIVCCDTGAEALTKLSEDVFDVMLLDLRLPDMEGMSILEYVHNQTLPTSVIIITAHGTIDLAVDAMNLGAKDFLVKPFDAKRLQITLRNVLKQRKLESELENLKDTYVRNSFEGFIGSSIAMQPIYRIIESAAPSKASIFITGESGTGKEVCAHAIHARSAVSSRPFIALNCAAIPRDLMESEIFGHIKGAFTGALQARQGAAELADGGTLFLDEICEMDLDLQSKLLRFIQSGTFQKVGSSNVQKVNVRFICATNRNPLAEVEKGRFREDLYYRLHVIPIQLPPLRERNQDVLEIADVLLKKIAAEENKDFTHLSVAVQNILLNYQWPGNIRQLENVIRQIVVLNQGKEVTPTMLPPPLNNIIAAPPSINVGTVLASLNSIETVTAPPEPVSIQTSERPWNIPNRLEDIPTFDEIERNVIEHVIQLCEENIPKAASVLGLSPSTIYRKRQAWMTERSIPLRS